MRRFELSEGKSNKFWEVSAEGASLTVTFGRMGTSGQTQTKPLGSPVAAQAEFERLVREKTKKGYVETGALAVVHAPSVPPPPQPAPPRGDPTPERAGPRINSTPAAKAQLDEEKERGRPRRELLASHSNLVGTLSLEAKQVAVLSALAPGQEMDGHAEEAAPMELPRVLVAPSWAQPLKPEPPPTHDGLLPLEADERIHFSDDERNRYGHPALSRADFLSMYVRKPVAARTPETDAFVLEKLYTWTYHVSSWFDLMSDNAAAKFFTERDLASLRPDGFELKYLLARFGQRAIPSVLACANASTTSAAWDALAHVESPRIAVAFGELATRTKRSKAQALAYFARYPVTSALGLVPFALAKKTQKTGIGALKLVAQGGRDGQVHEVAARHGADVAAKIERLLAWEGEAKKPGPLPAWFAPDRLPPVLVRGSERRLPASAVTHLASLLSISEPRLGAEGLDEVVAACTPDSLARFAWGLFSTWLSEGASAKEDWAMTALGHLAGDDAARRFARLVRAWPGESAHARAVKGLDVLAQMGSDVALSLLDGIAEKVKFKGLQERAREKIAEVADERGLTREQLADRVAPTLDLDVDGSRVLSFGARSFRVGFDEHLAPFVLDADGKRLTDLPKPKLTDDGEAAAEATQTWKTLKKDARTVASGQILRLERAMCTERRWTLEEFLSLLVAHPLVVHLVRRLLWGTFEAGRVVRLFRVAEDRTLANADDTTFTLPGDAVVGLIHRLELSDDDVRTWGQIFGDYEVVSPFPQLDRDVYAPDDAERAATTLKRTEGVEVPSGKVLGLVARGWEKGAPQDAGWIWEMQKPLPGDLVAVLHLDGGFLAGDMRESPPVQKLGAVALKRSAQRSAAGVPLGEVPSLVFSELVRDLEGLRA